MTSLPDSALLAPRARVAIVAPLAEEIAPLLHRAGPARTTRLGAVEVSLAVSGEGAERAAAAAADLLDRSRPSLLLVLGCAGGLTPGLPAGALVVAAGLRDGLPEPPRPDPSLVARAERAGALGGTVVSSPRILCTAAEKARAWAAAESALPAVVDLESTAYAREAASRSIPFVVVRAVLDPAEEDLPLDFNLFAADGQVRRSAVARRALLRPSLLRPLLDLRRRVRRSSELLARFASTFLEAER